VYINSNFTTQKINNQMKQLSLIALITTILFVSCKENKPVLKLGDRKILACFIDTAGNKYIDVLLQRVVDTIQSDSFGVKSKIIRAEIWGMPIYDSARDKFGKPILDSIKKQPTIIIRNYLPIPRERIILDISNKDYDSLMKKGNAVLIGGKP